jgi:hypothetical protein
MVLSFRKKKKGTEWMVLSCRKIVHVEIARLRVKQVAICVSGDGALAIDAAVF